MENTFIFFGLLLILIFFGITCFSVSKTKIKQKIHHEELHKAFLDLYEAKDIGVDGYQVLLDLEAELNSYLNSKESWVDYSFRKPEDLQRVSLLLEDDEIVFNAQYDPLNKTFHSVGLNISPLKVKQWKKLFS
jgi:hypothetical protein